jgi:XRE family aerobic/anaerobic benzoate catabolism transcriptional regulator
MLHTHLNVLRVRELRKRAGLSQKALAAAAGVCQSAISRIERGQRNASLTKLAAIARALRVPVKRLLG